MLNFDKGRPIAKIKGGKYDNRILYLEEADNDDDQYIESCCDKCSTKCNKRTKCCGGCNMCYKDEKKKLCCGKDKKSTLDKHSQLGLSFKIDDGVLIPLPKIYEREVNYITGPSGSGKSTYASNYIRAFKKIFPEKDFYAFSRTDLKNDPAFTGLNPIQITIDNSLVENPIDITSELTGGCIVLFDDVNTVQNDKQKKAIDKLMADIMEVGRKLGIWIVITNHLVIPSERKMARTVLNEMQSITVFPKSGAVQQIKYVFKQYFGLTDKQIRQIIRLPSRWITMTRTYPQYVLYNKGCILFDQIE